MNSIILMIVHQKSSVTGRIGGFLEQLGYALDVRCPLAGHALPGQLDHYAGVMSFGGPMSANDDNLPGIRAELEWLPRVLQADKPFLGICLGAQLLARCLGAKVTCHAQGLVEIGYYPIVPTGADRQLFSKTMHVYQWHREGFDLPCGAALLAKSDYFGNQAYRIGKNAFGIQFHPEVNQEMMARWLVNGAERLSLPGARPAAEHRTGHARYDPALNAWLKDFLDHWLASSDSESLPALAAD